MQEGSLPPPSPAPQPGSPHRPGLLVQPALGPVPCCAASTASCSSSAPRRCFPSWAVAWQQRRSAAHWGCAVLPAPRQRGSRAVHGAVTPLPVRGCGTGTCAGLGERVPLQPLPRPCLCPGCILAPPAPASRVGGQTCPWVPAAAQGPVSPSSVTQELPRVGSSGDGSRGARLVPVCAGSSSLSPQRGPPLPTLLWCPQGRCPVGVLRARYVQWHEEQNRALSTSIAWEPIETPQSPLPCQHPRGAAQPPHFPGGCTKHSLTVGAQTRGRPSAAGAGRPRWDTAQHHTIWHTGPCGHSRGAPLCPPEQCWCQAGAGPAEPCPGDAELTVPSCSQPVPPLPHSWAQASRETGTASMRRGTDF